MLVGAIISAVVGIASLITGAVVQGRAIRGQEGLTKEIALLQYTTFLKKYEGDQQFRFMVILVVSVLMIGLILYGVLKKVK